MAIDPSGLVVGKVGDEVYDRWPGRPGSQRGGAPDRAEAGPVTAPSHVVDPKRRGADFGRAMLTAVVRHPEVARLISASDWLRPDR